MIDTTEQAGMQAETAPETFSLPAYNSLVFRNGLQPFETKMIEIDGKPVEVPISLQLDIDGRAEENPARHFLFFNQQAEDESTPRGIHIIEVDDPQAEVCVPLASKFVPMPEESVTATIDKIDILIGSRNDVHGDMLSIKWDGYRTGQRTATAEVAPAAHTFVESPLASSDIINRKGRRRFLGKIAIGLVGLYSTLGSGGLIDKAADPFNDARDTVVSSVSLPEEHPDYFEGRRVDEMPVAAQTKVEAEAETEYQEAVAARDRVAQTMSDLDNHSYGRIKQRAAEFVTQQGDQLLTKDQVNEFYGRLDAAGDKEAIMRVLNDYLQFFNKEADWASTDSKSGATFDAEHTSSEDVRDVVHGIIDATSYLPRDLIVSADFNTFLIANKEDPLKGADYSSTHGTIVVPTSSTFGRFVYEAGDKLPHWFIDDYDLRQIILHELGHAYDFGIPDIAGAMPEHPGGKEILVQAAQDFLNVPEYPSQYATTGPGEARAETFASTLNRDKVVAHPDETRRYNSRANKWSIEILAALDARYPGITDYLVSLNPNLVGRSYVDIGR